MEDDSWLLVEKKGGHFAAGDRPFSVHGFNTYWLMVFAADPDTRSKVSDVLREASSAGLNVCRTWAFNDGGWRALQISPHVYDDQVLEVIIVFRARELLDDLRKRVMRFEVSPRVWISWSARQGGMGCG